MKVNNTEDLLNNALALHCLLNQMTQMDKDCDTYNEYIYIYGPEIGSYCLFFQILMWALSKTPLKIYSERKSLPNSGCYKSKKVSMFIIFIPHLY